MTKSVDPVLNVSAVVEVPVVTVFPFPVPFLSPTMAISSNSGRCKKMYNLTYCTVLFGFLTTYAFLNVIY